MTQNRKRGYVRRPEDALLNMGMILLNVGAVVLIITMFDARTLRNIVLVIIGLWMGAWFLCTLAYMVIYTLLHPRKTALREMVVGILSIPLLVIVLGPSTLFIGWIQVSFFITELLLALVLPGGYQRLRQRHHQAREGRQRLARNHRGRPLTLPEKTLLGRPPPSAHTQKLQRDVLLGVRDWRYTHEQNTSESQTSPENNEDQPNP